MRGYLRVLTCASCLDVFGVHLQDLPESIMVPVVVGGYRHYVPAVVQAGIDELYRTGASVAELSERI